jgi:hypothetical protein
MKTKIFNLNTTICDSVRLVDPIQQEDVTVSKKTLGIHHSPAVVNASHLTYIKEKATQWITRMQNGHLPNHIAWVAYKNQLWPGLRYGLGTMTNDLEAAKQLLDDTDWKTLNILSVLRNITKRDYRDSIQPLGASVSSASQPNN